MQAYVNEAGRLASNVKHMAAGRLALELPYVMPDLRTTYLTDDGDHVMFGMFKASTPGDLSCGTNYGAKFTQTSSENGALVPDVVVGAPSYRPPAKSLDFGSYGTL
jgi:hypothetical protein